MNPRRMVAMVLVAILVVYPLSTGPVMRFYKSRSQDSPPDTVVAIYLPLIWLCYNVPVAGEAFGWYIDLWASPGQFK